MTEVDRRGRLRIPLPPMPTLALLVMNNYLVVSLIDNEELFATQLGLAFVRCIRQVSTMDISVKK